jgi:hypothetical protein
LKCNTSLAPEREIFSEPAKSTKFSLPHFISSSPSGVDSLMWIVIENNECDRLKGETDCQVNNKIKKLAICSD